MTTTDQSTACACHKDPDTSTYADIVNCPIRCDTKRAVIRRDVAAGLATLPSDRRHWTDDGESSDD
jgi:hypothetical protein